MPTLPFLCGYVTNSRSPADEIGIKEGDFVVKENFGKRGKLSFTLHNCFAWSCKWDGENQSAGSCRSVISFGSDIPFGTKLNLWLNLRIIYGHLR